MSGFTATVSQWEIYDSYMGDYFATVAEAEALKAAEKKKSSAGHAGGGDAAYDPEVKTRPRLFLLDLPRPPNNIILLWV